jgi:hypothetical protein
MRPSVTLARDAVKKLDKARGSAFVAVIFPDRTDRSFVPLALPVQSGTGVVDFDIRFSIATTSQIECQIRHRISLAVQQSASLMLRVHFSGVTLVPTFANGPAAKRYECQNPKTGLSFFGKRFLAGFRT